jgi:hydroxymethylpyrimidine/phosphomethylpyrimidine kinase
VLVLAGLDPSGRAGLLADGEAIRAAGAQPVLCATAIAAQSEQRLALVSETSAEALCAQALCALEDGPVAAVKVGMVASARQVQQLVELFRGPLRGVPVIADPVFGTSSGGALFRGEPRDWLPLLPCTALVTPNLDEAERLSGRACRDESGMEAAARTLVEAGASAVLVKGGHLAGHPKDFLLAQDQIRWFSGERIIHRKRGTGCRLASSVAAWIALGNSLPESVEKARLQLRSWLAS